jgi:molecular chaperone GrpE
MADQDRDKEQEIPVKVIDRRWWANAEGSAASTEAPRSSKPSYVEELEQKLAQKEKEAQEYLAKYRQAATEFEDSRLRLRREISKDIERARRDVIAELLEVLDNLDRALDSAQQGASADAIVKGVEMVRQQFLAKLESIGVKRIDVSNQRFDPALHEAITTVPAASPDKDGFVIGIVRHGYKIGDDVLRPAAVAVAKS